MKISEVFVIILMAVFMLGITLFKRKTITKNTCDTCVNRKAVSNFSICNDCDNGNKYESLEDAIIVEVEDGNDI